MVAPATADDMQRAHALQDQIKVDALILIPALSYFLLRGASLVPDSVRQTSGAQTAATDISRRQGVPHTLT